MSKLINEKKLYYKTLQLAVACTLLLPVFSVEAYCNYGRNAYYYGRQQQEEYKELEAPSEIVAPHLEEYNNYISTLHDFTAYANKDKQIGSVIDRYVNYVNQINSLKDCNALQKQAKAKADTCYINIFSKDYNGALSKNEDGSVKKFYVSGRAEESRKIFFRNYELFGKDFTLHFPEDEAKSMGFSSNTTSSARETFFLEGLADLRIFKGKSKEEVNFCYSNMLASESPMLGATEAIKLMLLRATTDVDALSKRAAIIKHFVDMLEDPAQADFLEQNLQNLMKFEEDFLQIRNNSEKGRTVLGDEVQPYFFSVSKMLGLNDLTENIESLARSLKRPTNSKNSYNDEGDDDDNSTKKSINNAMDKTKRVTNRFFGKINAKIKRGIDKFKRKVDENELFLTFGIPWRIYNSTEQKFDKLKEFCKIFTANSSDNSRYGFSLREMYRAYKAGDFLSLSTLIQKAGYTLLFKDHVECLSSLWNKLPDIEKDPQTGSLMICESAKKSVSKWADELKTYKSINPIHVLNNALLGPLNKVKTTIETFDGAANDLMFNLGNLPGNGIASLFTYQLKQLAGGPNKIIEYFLNDVRKNLPNAFNYSYEKLIGISRFFQAASNISSCFDAKRKTNPEISVGLKLFDYLDEFNSWMSQNNGNYTTPLDRHRKIAVFKMEQRITEIEAEIKELEKTEIKNKENAIEKLKQDQDKLEEDIRTYSDKLNVENGAAIAKLIKLLKTKLFLEKPEEKSFLKRLIKGDVGKITITFKRMVELQEHFYPMYQALSELVAMIALAKKIVKSKTIAHNKYCVVDFETNSTTPHFKVTSGWNPTAVLDPKHGFHYIVPSSFELGGRSDGKDRHMVLTGSNGKGKSTLMRASAYQIWTAQTLGIAPAEALTLTPFNFIYSLKKDVEDESKGQSTHMKQIAIVFDDLKGMINEYSKKGQFSWINCDEMFNGTASGSATANTLTFMKELPAECLCCVATHHKEVPTIAKDETDGTAVCYKINNDSNQLEKGELDMIAESTNAKIMDEKQIDKDTIENVMRIEKKLALAAMSALGALKKKGDSATAAALT